MIAICNHRNDPIVQWYFTEYNETNTNLNNCRQKHDVLKHHVREARVERTEAPLNGNQVKLSVKKLLRFFAQNS